MHIRVPKPLHGWREFLGEVGIIVLGVLIALAAEQSIEAWRWQRDVDEAKQALRQDFVSLLVFSSERRAYDACARARLGELQYLARFPSAFPAITQIGTPPLRVWYPVSWSSTVSSQVAVKFPRADLLLISRIAAAADVIGRANNQELDDWAQLHVLVGQRRPLSFEERGRVQAAIADAAYRLNLIRLYVPNLQKALLASHILQQSDLATAQNDFRSFLRAPERRALCRHLPQVKSVRFEAPYDPQIEP